MSDDEGFKKLKHQLDKTTVYQYFRAEDPDLIRILQWINTLEIIANDMAGTHASDLSTGYLKRSIDGLVRQVGIRAVAVFRGVLADCECSKDFWEMTERVLYLRNNETQAE